MYFMLIGVYFQPCHVQPHEVEMDEQRAPLATSRFTTEGACMADVLPKTQVPPGVTQRKDQLQQDMEYLGDIVMKLYVHRVLIKIKPFS